MIPAPNPYGDYVQADRGGQDERSDSDPHVPLHENRHCGNAGTRSRFPHGSGFACRLD
jgi:hypothetical protein